MDAIRVARAATGRDDIVKIEGSYHGHHDTVMFSVVPNAESVGGLEHAPTLPMSKGIPADVARHTRVVPFNDAPALDALLAEHADTTACLILEPVMMNIGLVEPEPGYLEAVREICTRRGVVLIFDEVKSGATVAPGGATERYGVQPDLACFAKAICGGYARCGVRWARRPHGRDRPRRRPTGHLQRQPAHRGRRPRGADRGHDPRRVRLPRRARNPARRRHPDARSMPTTSPRTPSTSVARARSRSAAPSSGTTATSSGRTTRSTKRRTRGR